MYSGIEMRKLGRFRVDKSIICMLCAGESLAELTVHIAARAVMRFKYQGALVSRAPNKPKYKLRNIREKSNESSPTERALPNALTGVCPGGPGPPGREMIFPRMFRSNS